MMPIERAIVAEFYKTAGGRLELFSVVVEDCEYRKTYDVERSRKYGYIFHMSGAGGADSIPVRGIHHVSGAVEVEEHPADWVDARDKPPWRGRRTRAIRKRNQTRRLRRLPKAFNLGGGQDLLDWLRGHAIEADAVWCSVCRDFFPEDSTCEHVWWCDDKCWWSTPDDRCDHKKECCK
jgi:hypothetical protein